MENLIDRMREVLKNEIAERHSYFQMKYFIVNKEPTVQAKMWQCLREIKSRYESLEALELELEDSKDNLELIDIDINKISKTLDNKTKEFTEIKRKKLEILLRKTKRKKIVAEKNLQELAKKKKYLEEESNFFVVFFKEIEKIEPLKNYDDLDVQKEYWNEKLLQKVNLKMLMQNHVDTELIETVLALPDDVHIKMQTVKHLDDKHQHLLNIKTQMENSISNK